MDEPLKCPSVGRVLGTMGPLTVAGLVFVIWWLSTCAMGLWRATDVWNALTPTARYTTIAVFGLMSLTFLVMSVMPLIVMWPYLAFRLRHRDLAELRVTPDALIYVARDASSRRLSWADLVSFTGAGSLVFGSQSDQRFQVYLPGNPVWRFVRERLRRTRPETDAAPSMCRVYRRLGVTAVVVTIGIELLLPVLIRAMGVEPSAPRGLFLAAGGSVALAMWLAARGERASERRRSTMRARRCPPVRVEGARALGRGLKRSGARGWNVHDFNTPPLKGGGVLCPSGAEREGGFDSTGLTALHPWLRAPSAAKRVPHPTQGRNRRPRGPTAGLVRPTGLKAWGTHTYRARRAPVHSLRASRRPTGRGRRRRRRLRRRRGRAWPTRLRDVLASGASADAGTARAPASAGARRR